MKPSLLIGAVTAGVLALVLSGCTGGVSESPSPAPSVTATNPESSNNNESDSTVEGDSEEVAPEANANATETADLGEKLFETLPEAPWEFTSSEAGVSATLNELFQEPLEAWITTQEADGWDVTVTQNDETYYVGYASKDRYSLSFMSAVNPSNATPITMIFFYDSATTGGVGS